MKYLNTYQMNQHKFYKHINGLAEWEEQKKKILFF